MVAIVAGNGLGLVRTSGFVIGSQGQVGQAELGRGTENVYVNAANGNLVINHTDDILIGRGLDHSLGRTYNSLGTMNDDNGDNWRTSAARTIVPATPGTSSPTQLVRTDWDGSESVYTLSGGVYTYKGDTGADDTIIAVGDVWVWEDGNTHTTETYNSAGRIASSSDTDGNTLTFTYSGARLSKIVTETGESTEFNYFEGTSRIAKVVTRYTVNEVDKAITRVHYTYDAQHRLETVTLDLTPEDNSISGANEAVPNNIYVTTYTYRDETSRDIASIKQSDGSELAIEYGNGKVSKLTQVTAAGKIQTTEFTYTLVPNSENRKIQIKDSLDQTTTLICDAKDRLLSIDRPPATPGETPLRTRFTWTSSGDVAAMVDSANGVTRFYYDARGNLTLQRDPSGNTIERTYGAVNNELFTEIVYLAPDPDDTGSQLPSEPRTTRYFYDDDLHLTYMVSPEGRVTEYIYTASGRRSDMIQYTGKAMVLTSLGSKDRLNQAVINNWKSGLVLTESRRTGYLYDHRGNLERETFYDEVGANGVGIGSGHIVYYIYDQSGKLLSRQLAVGTVPGRTAKETYVYDGMWRITSSTDMNGTTTGLEYRDVQRKTVVTLESGLVQTSTFNHANQLISYSESGVTGTALPPATRSYDALGRLQIASNVLAQKTHYVYDGVGRKVAEIDPTGSTVEYRYNATGQVVTTIRYQNPARNLDKFADPLATPADISIANIRPVADGIDRYEWRIYDKSQRLVATVDAMGAVVAYTYDGASRLQEIRAYATKVPVAGFQATAPTLATFIYPDPDADGDRVTRNFYDQDGLLIGTLDGEGALSQTVYDQAGQAIRTIRYANLVDSTDLRASGSWGQLRENVTRTTNANDIREYFFYDGRGLLRAAIDGERNLTRFEYDAAGNVRKQIRGQRVAAIPATLGEIPEPTSHVLDEIAYVRSPHGQLISETKTLAGGLSETTNYFYDSMQRLVRVTTAASNDIRISNMRYDLRGRLIGEISSREGHKALDDLPDDADALAISAVYAQHGTVYGYDQGDRLILKRTPSGTDATSLRTVYYYNADNRLVYEINATGEVIEHLYNSFGERSFTVIYANRIAAGIQFNALTGGGNLAPVEELVDDVRNTDGALTQDGIANGSIDSRSALYYDAAGRLRKLITALGGTASYTYNAFGELDRRTDVVTVDANNVVTSTIQTARLYDRRGLLESETVDDVAGGLALQTRWGYDAFGRAIQETDAANRVRGTTYDRAGHVSSRTDAYLKSHSFEYDPRGNLVTMKDWTQGLSDPLITTYSYNAFNREVTVTTPEKYVTTTTHNAYGQVIKVRDPELRETSYAYDSLGNLVSVTDAAGKKFTNEYDDAGRLETTVDANGAKTQYVYDRANRLWTRTVDLGTNKLNLTTKFEYNSRGQQVKITDAAGVVTLIDFDRAGRQVLVTRDVGTDADPGVSLKTSYAYDLTDRLLTVTEDVDNAAQVTGYEYDKGGRLLKVTQHPGGGIAPLETRYVYDAVGNAVARIDANDDVTRYVFDNENRQILSVDPTGSVVRTGYDNKGRVEYTRAYVTKVPDGFPADFQLTEGHITGDVSNLPGDRVVRYAYDDDGRLRFEVDALGLPTEYIRDEAGNILKTIQYGAALAELADYDDDTIAAGIAAAVVDGVSLLNHAQTRISRTIYDSANRPVYAIDAENFVTRISYDGNGNVVSRRQYSTAYHTAADQPDNVHLDSWANGHTPEAKAKDRVLRTAYDGAGRVAFSLDGENYVTAYTRDGNGNVIKQVRFAKFYNSTQAPSFAAMTTWVPNNDDAALDAVTRAAYDGAGRLVFDVDATGYVTEYRYSGRVRDEIVYARSYAILDGATVASIAAEISAPVASYTRRILDGAGRVVSETLGHNSAAAATTKYGYDGAGRLKTVTDPRGAVTIRDYDAMGRVTRLRAPLTVVGSVTTYADTLNEYDAFGNLVRVTDPQKNVGYFYYDKLDRLVLQIDPERYATRTAYSIGNEAIKVSRYATPLDANLLLEPGIVPLVPTTEGEDAYTSFGRDKLDRLTSVKDALYKTESYELDAFGNRSLVTSRVGGTTVNVYDRNGRLLSETVMTNAGTVITDPRYVTNSFKYDARGNRIETTEAEGRPEARVTGYEYDDQNRLTHIIGEAVTVIDPVTLAESENKRPVQAFGYDARGNLIETRLLSRSGTVDTQVSRTLAWFDALGRKTAELVQTGGTAAAGIGSLTAWTYDGNGNAATMTRFDASVTLPAAAGGVAPVGTGVNRHIVYTHDAANRLTGTSLAGVKTGAWIADGDTGVYTVSDAAITTGIGYDANGNVTSETDGNGNKAYTYYDKAGRVVGRVDRGGYLTSYTLDSDGNVTREERFAALAPGGAVFADRVAALRAAGNPDDRVTEFEYDLNGRRLLERRLGVVHYQLTGTGALAASSSTGASVVRYTYDALGQMLSREEANGDLTSYEYDKLGRQTKVKEAIYKDEEGADAQPITLTSYDGLGNVTSVSRSAHPDGLRPRIAARYEYEQGRMVRSFDAVGFKREYGYDIAGNVTYESWERTTSTGAKIAEGRVYRYDAANRLVGQGGAIGGAVVTASGHTRYRYNGFGEVSGKGLGSSTGTTYQESFFYDRAGRVYRSNAGDGSTRMFLYDGNGARTATIASSGGGAGANLALLSLADGVALFDADATPNLLDRHSDQAVLTIEILDRRGQSTQTREQGRRIDASGTPQNILKTRYHNAFGEVRKEIDARNNVTEYLYNKMGRLVRTVLPETNVTGENGVTAFDVVLDELYHYDIAGRLIGKTDANKHVTARELLAGTGHGGTEAKVARERQADGITQEYLYDGYGDLQRHRWIQVTASGDRDLKRTTDYEYDAMGRLTELAHATRFVNADLTPNSNDIRLTDHYSYDELGQRTRHWNSFQGAAVTETTDYDFDGRVVSTRDYGGATTSYAYTWSGTHSTSGIAAAGGWKKVTTTPFMDGTVRRTASETIGYFGQMITRTDLGGHVYSFTYDTAGRLVAQTNNSGQNLAYSWYNGGRMAGIVDTSGPRLVSEFAYDRAGNRVGETYHRLNADGSKTWYQQSTATYDERGRIESFAEKGDDDANKATVTYKYDAVGNVRHIKADYQWIGAAENVTGAKNHWYLYDKMNRFTVSKGLLIGGEITTSLAGGTKITYDDFGQRKTAESYGPIKTFRWVKDENQNNPGESDVGSYVDDSGEGLRRETYGYTTDGYLDTVKIAQDSYDHLTGDTTGTFGNDRLRADYTRDALGRVTGYVEYGEEVDSSKPTFAIKLVETYRRQAIVYNAAGQLDIEEEVHRRADGTSFTQTSDNVYTGGLLTGTVRDTSNGQEWESYRDGVTTYDYVWWDGAQQSEITFNRANSDTDYTTSFVYNAADGHIVSAAIIDQRPRDVAYVTDAAGRVLTRSEEERNYERGDPVWKYFYFDGLQMGDISNDGPSDNDYLSSIVHRAVEPKLSPWSNYKSAVNHVDFDQNFDPINPSTDSGGGRYTAQDGDTLQTVAAAVWGDAAMWYLLADANGMTGDTQLAAGMSLIIPAKVANVHNNADTFKPYDPNKAIGDVSPTEMKPPERPKQPCGMLGAIILVAIAVAVSVVTAGAAAAAMLPGVTSIMGGMTALASGFAGLTISAATAIGVGVTAGAIGGALGSMVSQGFGVATGLQDSFSWKGVAMSALSGAVGGGMGASGAFNSVSSPFFQGVLRGATANAITQGVATATGLQDSFDWVGVAVGGVVGGTVRGLGLTGFGGQLVGGMAGAIAGAATRSALTGTSFGDNILAALPDVIGATIGNMIGEAVVGGLSSGASLLGGGSSSDGANSDDGGPSVAGDMASYAAHFPDGATYSMANYGSNQDSGEIVVTATLRPETGFFGSIYKGLGGIDRFFNGLVGNADNYASRIAMSINSAANRGVSVNVGDYAHFSLSSRGASVRVGDVSGRITADGIYGRVNKLSGSISSDGIWARHESAGSVSIGADGLRVQAASGGSLSVTRDGVSATLRDTTLKITGEGVNLSSSSASLAVTSSGVTVTAGSAALVLTRETASLTAGPISLGTGASATVGAAPQAGVDLLRSHPDAHAFARHGGIVTDADLITRATTGLAPDLYQAKVIPKMSSAFYTDDLLRFADQQIRNGGALDAAISAAPAGAARVTVDPSLVGDLGVNVGRGYERIAKLPGYQGPVRLVPDLRSATGTYVLNPATGNWETLTVYPTR